MPAFPLLKEATLSNQFQNLEYGTRGNSVNIASRLESCEQDREEDTCQILIAEETLLHLAGKFAVESWGALALKAREQKVNVYGILGMKKSKQTAFIPKHS